MLFTNEGTSIPVGMLLVVKGGIANLNLEFSWLKYRECSFVLFTIVLSSSFDELLVASVLSEFAFLFVDVLIELISFFSFFKGLDGLIGLMLLFFEPFLWVGMKSLW